MRKLVIALTMVLGLVFAGPASAEIFADTDLMVAQGALGLNGMITSPADPIMGLIEGDDLFSTPVVGVVTDHVTDRMVGVVTGTMLGTWRLLTGTANVLTCPTVLGPWGPDPRFLIVPGSGE